jgi:hypothetical protein
MRSANLTHPPAVLLHPTASHTAQQLGDGPWLRRDEERYLYLTRKRLEQQQQQRKQESSTQQRVEEAQKLFADGERQSRHLQSDTNTCVHLLPPICPSSLVADCILGWRVALFWSREHWRYATIPYVGQHIQLFFSWCNEGVAVLGQ